MYDFKRLLHWKLLAGSHEFPGPYGGTCINEAAIVAAGIAYREIGSPRIARPVSRARSRPTRWPSTTGSRTTRFATGC